MPAAAYARTMHLDPRSAPESAEQAVILTMMSLGRRIRTRREGDAVDPVLLPLLHALRHSGPTRLGDLAERVHLDASTISRHVRHLQDEGLVTRSEHPEDGRVRLIALSARGGQYLDETFEHRVTVIGEALAEWSVEDREQLRTVLTRLTASLEPS